jgi:phosphoribosyl 1,2-cyclic phosphodiesterase
MNPENVLRIKFWGVRGSYPRPGAETVKYGGNTPCVQISMGRQLLILDAGTGIIGLGRELVLKATQYGQALRITLLFSHMHHDHTQGFPFFMPAYLPTARLAIFGPQTFEQALNQNMLPPFFPVLFAEMNAAKEIHSVGEGQVIMMQENQSPELITGSVAMQAGSDGNMVKVRVLRSPAHPGGVLIYRIEWRGQTVVYASDTEGYVHTDRRLANFAQGADVLIHDAQYTEEHYLGQLPGVRSTQGWGHSTVRMACELAQVAGVRRLALFHHDPGYSDADIERNEISAQKLFAGAFAAKEGLEVLLSGEQRVEPTFERAGAAPALRQGC